MSTAQTDGLDGGISEWGDTHQTGLKSVDDPRSWGLGISRIGVTQRQSDLDVFQIVSNILASSEVRMHHSIAQRREGMDNKTQSRASIRPGLRLLWGMTGQYVRDVLKQVY